MTTIKIVSRWDSTKVLFEYQTTEGLQAVGLAVREALLAACSAGANLAGANLAGAYLSEVSLYAANLTLANLQETNLACAELTNANLAGANLEEANLEGTYLQETNLAGANLEGAYLEGAYLAGANLAGANLAGANLAGANLTRTYLQETNLAGANLTRTYLQETNLEGAYLEGAYLEGAGGKKLTLVGNRPVLQIGPIGSRSALLSLYLTDAGPMVLTGCFWDTLVAFEDRCALTHGDNEHGKEYGFAALLMRAHAELWTPTKDHP